VTISPLGITITDALAVGRYLPSGALDPSFNAGGPIPGIVTIMAPGAPFDNGEGVLLQSSRSNAIVVSTYTALARFTGAGSLDTSFGGSGTGFALTTGIASRGELALDPNGELLISGESTSSNLAVAAYLPDGASDTTFGTGGVASANFPGGAEGFGIAIQPSDGKIVVAGSVNGSSAVVAIARFLPPSAGPSLVVAGFPSSAALGMAGTFAVTAKNADGTIDTGYAGAIHFTSSDPKAVLPADYTFTAADHGVHTFSATFETAAMQALTATDMTTGANGYEAGIKIFDPAVADPASSTISVAPATIFSGGSATVTLTARNDAGNLVTTGGLPFSFGASGGNLFSSATFSNLTDNHNGTYTAIFTGNTALAPATYTIAATLGGQAIATPLPTITVLPAVPATQIAITNASATNLVAGGSVSVTVTAEDSTGTTVPGYTGTVQLTSTDGHAALGGNGLPASYSFLPSDNGVHTFTVTLATPGSQTITVSDQANSSLAATTKPITVTAGSPKFVVSIPGGNVVVAGSPFLFTVQATDPFGNPLTSYSGPTTITVAASPPDPQDNLPITGTLNSSGFAFFLGNLKTAGSYTLTTTAGTSTGTSGGITVIPADANHFTVTAPAAATTGSPVSATVTALDPYGNVATNYGGKVHLTSSDPHAVLPADATLSGGVGVFSVTLTSAGSQTITANDTLSTNPAIIGTSNAINTRGLTVTSLTPTATGFTVTFSKPIVPSDISLYGGTVANPIQNVTLVGKNTGPIFGPVNGTLVIDSSGTSATFKASSDWLANIAGSTSGVLPNDTWTVTLQSGTGAGASANGFFDALGAPLDGANNGDHANYVTTFATANDGKPALTIPDFARGPDGATTIKVPNSADGIPVTLANAPAGTKDVAFTLSYDPTLLTVTNAGTGDSSGTGSTFTMGTPANGKVTFIWHNSAGLSGNIVLGDILANVPSSAANQYHAKELLTLDGITVNGAAFTGVTSPAVHVNAYFGDLSGDGQLTGLDLAMAGNMATGTPASPIGLAAYRLVDPGLIGDIGGNGSIDSAAISSLAGFLAQVATPAIPALPSGLTITPGGPDPALSLGSPQSQKDRQGDGEEGRQGDSRLSPILPLSSSPLLSVTVPVLLDNPQPQGSAGITEAILALTYDPNVLSVSAADITLGTIPDSSSGWRLESMIDQATGQIGIDLYSTTPITDAEAGSLVNITFHLLPGANTAATKVQLVSAVTPQNRWFGTEVADGQGQLVLSPGVDEITIQTGVHPVFRSPIVTHPWDHLKGRT
jgi:uncharacterized delta-60 repeat protein